MTYPSNQSLEQLNRELQLTTHKLTLLLDLSNLLAEPMSLQDRLERVLDKIISSLDYFNAGLFLLTQPGASTPYVAVALGLRAGHIGRVQATNLGLQCIERGLAMCRHINGEVIEFLLEDLLETQQCRQQDSPVEMISLPLSAQQQVIGSIVLAGRSVEQPYITAGEFTVLMGIGQQLGLSIDNARLHQEAQSQKKMLGELLHQVVGAQEAERQRIARELHDATGQALTAITLGLRGVETLLVNDAPVAVDQIRELKKFGTNALGELRELIANLRPAQLDDLGLVAALQWYVKTFQNRRDIETTLVINGAVPRLPTEYEIVLFRIVQEALANIAKHAHASKAMVTLKIQADQIDLSIEDNGQGFDPDGVFNDEQPRSGWGLLGIRERALLLGGNCTIDSKPRQGTRVRVKVPMIMEADDAKN